MAEIVAISPLKLSAGIGASSRQSWCIVEGYRQFELAPKQLERAIFIGNR
jgi:hypothetical protein